jgi:hypothetical protein
VAPSSLPSVVARRRRAPPSHLSSTRSLSLWVYAMPHNLGMAPCEQESLLSLALCKPDIRKNAVVGEYVIGIMSKSLKMGDRAWWIGRVSEVLTLREYYTTYMHRRDAIYRVSADGELIHKGESPFHNGPDEKTRNDQRQNDKEGNVLMFDYYATFDVNDAPEVRKEFTHPFVGQKSLPLTDDVIAECNRLTNGKHRAGVPARNVTGEGGDGTGATSEATAPQTYAGMPTCHGPDDDDDDAPALSGDDDDDDDDDACSVDIEPENLSKAWEDARGKRARDALDEDIAEVERATPVTTTVDGINCAAASNGGRGAVSADGDDVLAPPAVAPLADEGVRAGDDGRAPPHPCAPPSSPPQPFAARSPSVASPPSSPTVAAAALPPLHRVTRGAAAAAAAVAMVGDDGGGDGTDDGPPSERRGDGDGVPAVRGDEDAFTVARLCVGDEVLLAGKFIGVVVQAADRTSGCRAKYKDKGAHYCDEYNQRDADEGAIMRIRALAVVGDDLGDDDEDDADMGDDDESDDDDDEGAAVGGVARAATPALDSNDNDSDDDESARARAHASALELASRLRDTRHGASARRSTRRAVSASFVCAGAMLDGTDTLLELLTEYEVTVTAVAEIDEAALRVARWNLEALDAAGVLVLAPSCSFEPDDLSSAVHMRRVLGGVELVFASPPCQAWLYAGDADGDKTGHAVPSFRLFEALARAELPQLEVVVVENSIRALCGGSKRLNGLMKEIERRGWSGFTMPVAGQLLDGGAYPSAQAKHNAVLLLARRPAEAMRRVARDFADAMLKEHVPGSTLIGKQFGLFLSNRSTKIVGQYHSRYGKYTYDLDTVPAPALPRGQVSTTIQLAAGAKPELMAKMLHMAAKMGGRVRPSDDCPLACAEGITADDILALQGRSRWEPGGGHVFSFPPSFVAEFGCANHSKIIAEAFSGAGSRAIARAAMQALRERGHRGIVIGRIERWLPAAGHKRKVTNGAAGGAEQALDESRGWKRTHKRYKHTAVSGVVWNVRG